MTARRGHAGAQGPAGHRPRKRFGQHFLVPAWARKVVDAIDPQPDQTIVEIGPGRGALTRQLVERAGAVIAIEVDRDLAASLDAEHIGRLTVLTADVLRVNFDTIGVDAGARLAGNLPYNISSPILFHLLDDQARRSRFTDATLMLQKEVADRLAASPGRKEYGPLTIAVALHARVTRLLVLPPAAFHPAPRVTSAVVRLSFLPASERPIVPPVFMPMIRALFSARRKTLANGLKALAQAAGVQAADVALAAGIDPAARAEQLSVAELLALSERLAAARPPGG